MKRKEEKEQFLEEFNRETDERNYRRIEAYFYFL